MNERRVPLLKFRYCYEPSIDLADVPEGGTFKHVNGKRYLLVKRDPWKATIIRYTWLDAVLERIGLRVRECFTKK